jgi:hypothetical protein
MVIVWVCGRLFCWGFEGHFKAFEGILMVAGNVRRRLGSKRLLLKFQAVQFEG